MIVFVEKLSVINLFFYVLPYLIKNKLITNQDKLELYYLFGGKFVLWLIGSIFLDKRINLSQMKFVGDEVIEKNGTTLWQNMTYVHALKISNFISKSQAYKTNLNSIDTNKYFNAYIKKQCLPGVNIMQERGLWRCVYLIYVCIWKARDQDKNQSKIILFLQDRVLMSVLEDYFKDENLRIIPLSKTQNLLDSILRISGRNIKQFYNYIICILKTGGMPLTSKRNENNIISKIALQSLDLGHLSNPERASEWFFFQQSELSGESIVPVFFTLRKLLSPSLVEQMELEGIKPISLRFSPFSSNQVKTFYKPFWIESALTILRLMSRSILPYERKWFKSEHDIYQFNKEYWKQFFFQNKIRVYLSRFKFDAEHCVISDALNELDSVSALYLRSFEANPSAKTTVCADLMFGYSQLSAKVEKESQSNIPFYIVTGYLGDHRFPLVKGAAEQVRESLIANGANFIISFFDENSLEDPRWGPAHTEQQHHYEFILNKILEDPELGLVLKPKTPNSLRRRLGRISELLDQALATKRCYLYEDAVIQSFIPPAQAALSADIAIHSSLAAATAGVEAILAGVPTLFINCENFSISPLYELGMDNNIFNNWDNLWDVLYEYRNNSKFTNYFSINQQCYEHFDPFRDGKAAERMGTFLNWLVDGFEKDMPKVDVLQSAAERYGRQWGNDKVLSI